MKTLPVIRNDLAIKQSHDTRSANHDTCLANHDTRLASQNQEFQLCKVSFL